MQDHRPFHLAFSISDLEATRSFYRDILGCQEGRSTLQWIDFDFWGNQLSLHLGSFLESQTESQVAGKFVPMPHFGAVLKWDEFQALVGRLEKADVEFIEKPEIRYQGQSGEQATLYVRDQSGNALDFRDFRNAGEIFAK